MEEQDDFQFVDFSGGVEPINDDDDEPLFVDEEPDEPTKLKPLQPTKKTNVVKNSSDENSLIEQKKWLISSKKFLDNDREKFKTESRQLLVQLNTKSQQLDKIKCSYTKELEEVKNLRSMMKDEYKKFNDEREQQKHLFEKLEKQSKNLENLMKNDSLSNLKQMVSKQKTMEKELRGLVKQWTSNKDQHDSNLLLEQRGQKEIDKLSTVRSEQEKVLELMRSELKTLREYKEEQAVSLRKAVEDFKKKAAEIAPVKSKGPEPLLVLKEKEAYCCRSCATHIASEKHIESRSYQVGQGQFTEKKRGYLFCESINLDFGVSKKEAFTTGSYDICWVSCRKCGSQLGWKYQGTDSETNKSKIGKFCLSRASLTSFEERV